MYQCIICLSVSAVFGLSTVSLLYSIFVTNKHRQMDQNIRGPNTVAPTQITRVYTAGTGMGFLTTEKPSTPFS